MVMLDNTPAIAEAVNTLQRLVGGKADQLTDTGQAGVWRNTIREGLRAGVMTPAVVEAYAALHLRTDTGEVMQPAAHHRLWLHFLCDERIDNLLILAPPEAAKTTWVVSAWAGARIGFYPEEPVIICSETGGTARKRTLSLRNQTQSLSWQATFRNVRQAEGMIWHHEEWSLAPNGQPYNGRIHPTCSAFGVDGQVTGARGRVIVGDDVISRRNSRTQGRRTEVKEFISSTLIPRRMTVGGVTSRVVFIGTPYHPDDYYAEAEAAGDFVVVKTPMLSDGDDVYAEVTYPDWWQWETIGEPARGTHGEVQWPPDPPEAEAQRLDPWPPDPREDTAA